jgi:translation initiation factor IF-2
MVKKRVHELAKELNIESKEIIKRLKQMGIEVKSHMSTIEDKDVGEILRQFRNDSRVDEKKVSERTSKVSETRGTATPPARETRIDTRRDKETGVLESKKTDKSRGTQGSSRQRTDYNRGPGLVDRVPSRPPDRRFQEKQPEKQARPWASPKTEQQTSTKAVESSPERPKLDNRQQERNLQEKRQVAKPPAEQPVISKPQQERPAQSRPYGEPARQDRLLNGRNQGQGRPQTQGRTPGPVSQQGPASRQPRQAGQGRQQEQRPSGGFRPGGGTAATGARTKEPVSDPATSGRRTFDRGPGSGVKPRSDQPAARAAGWAEDKGKIAPIPVKVPDKPKQSGKPGSQKTNKGRYEKRNAIAEQAEGKLRLRTGPRKKGAAKSHEIKPLQPVEKKPVVLGESTTVQELSLKMHKSPAELIKKLFSMGVLVTINQEIDTDTAIILAEEYGYEVEVKLPVDLEAQLMQEPEEDSALLEPRPCIVTVMGHVDHGKTSLLDAIRQTNVTATEAGGITQHIGAYQVEHNGKKITFVDTPGHEAFTAMRARGAQVTDIAILVVAADDGVMPQTVEAINHAKDAKVPIIVAINKIDKPGANPERVKQELTEHGMVVEEWGGETICVNVSALKREGITDLLEMILLVAEVAELKANPNRPARGTVIEAELDKARGPVANVLVQNGTLNIGDTIIAGAAFGRVRAMMDDKGRRIKKAGPSTPVEVIGFSDVPQAGDIFLAVEDEKLARTIVARRQTKKREEELKSTTRVSLEDLFKHIQEGQIKELGIIIKADVQGSVEALRQALERLNTGEVKVNIIHGGVGAITETDIMFASASNAIIIGFNVRPDVNARKAAENEKVDVRLYRVIYDAIEDVKAAMSGLLDPEYKEVTLGRAEIRKIFKASKIGTIAGCYVLEGKIERDAGVRIVRDGIVVHEGKLDSLKRFKDDVKEVVQGYECGLAIEKFNEIKEGDIIEAFSMEAVKRELS